MTHQVQCSRCGHSNEPGRLFCMQCGAKLDLSAVVLKRVSFGRRFGAAFVYLLRLSIFLALVAGIVALLVPPQRHGALGTPVHAQQAARRLAVLKQAWDYGQRASQVLTELEVNAYLAEAAAKAPAPRWYQPKVRAVNVDFGSGVVTVLVLANWGPLPLSYQLQGRPRDDDRGVTLTTTGTWWGRMPLPGGADPWVRKRIGEAMAGLDREMAILRAASDVSVGQGLVRVTMPGR